MWHIQFVALAGIILYLQNNLYAIFLLLIEVYLGNIYTYYMYIYEYVYIYSVLAEVRHALKVSRVSLESMLLFPSWY